MWTPSAELNKATSFYGVATVVTEDPATSTRQVYVFRRSRIPLPPYEKIQLQMSRFRNVWLMFHPDMTYKETYSPLWRAWWTWPRCAPFLFLLRLVFFFFSFWWPFHQTSPWDMRLLSSWAPGSRDQRIQRTWTATKLWRSSPSSRCQSRRTDWEWTRAVLDLGPGPKSQGSTQDLANPRWPVAQSSKLEGNAL